MNYELWGVAAYFVIYRAIIPNVIFIDIQTVTSLFFTCYHVTAFYNYFLGNISPDIPGLSS